MKIFYFPGQNAIKQHVYNYLTNNPPLPREYLQRNGIPQAISELAARRFADSRALEKGVKIGNEWLIHELQTGKDGWTGEEIVPNLSHLQLCPVIWTALSNSTEKALLDCGCNGL